MEKDLIRVQKKIEKTYKKVEQLLKDKQFDLVDDIEIQFKKELTRESNQISKKYKVEDKRIISNILFGVALVKREEIYFKAVK